MKFKKENGFTTIDITVALIIILLFMSLIATIFFNITKSSRGIDRDSEATYIATDVIETIKLMKYDELYTTNGEVELKIENGEAKYVGQKNGEDVKVSLGSSINIKNGYTCKINIENHVPTGDIGKSTENNDLIKKVAVKVEYKLAGEIKNIQLNTTIMREI